jgi:mannose/fructose/N-acetylgalactosamine-specific phosphotransferase system component IID
VYRQQLQVRQ